MVTKRGRKKTTEDYFGPEEEEAVVKFLSSEDEYERNLIFNEWLRPAINKMAESIIRKYKLHRKGITFDESHTDAISFLMIKAHKFKPELGKKAYSYFGTVIKHYCLGLLQKDRKHLKSTISYEDISSDLEEREDLTYVIDAHDFQVDEFIKKLSNGIKDELNNESKTSKKRLSDNEKKVGEALVEILDNWETVFESMNGGPKYNKISVLETMRNYTNLSTKDIRNAMRRYKVLYDFLKKHGLT